MVLGLCWSHRRSIDSVCWPRRFYSEGSGATRRCWVCRSNRSSYDLRSLDMQNYRCPQCRTRRASWSSLQEHLKKSGHKLCSCGGYHYKHRMNSPLCHENPLSSHNFYRQTNPEASEEELLDVLIEIGLHVPLKISKECPF